MTPILSERHAKQLLARGLEPELAVRYGSINAILPTESRARRWQLANPERYREGNRRAKKAKPEKYRAIDTKAKARWRAKNPGHAVAQAARRKDRKRVTWPTELSHIERFYRECPEGHHVDHIVPFFGVTSDGHEVSGLHVLANLQYLPAAVNLSKNNRMRRTEQELCEAC